MSKAMSGLLGAFAGGLEGYSAGKLGEVKNFQESNMMLIKDIMDRKNKEFDHRLGLERLAKEDEYSVKRLGIANEYQVEGREDQQNFDLDMLTKEQKHDFAMNADRYGYDAALEKLRQSGENYRASLRGSDVKFSDYINPTTGETKQISEGGDVPKGFFPASYAASTGKEEKFDPEVEDYKLGRKRNALLSKFGMVGDEVGNVSVKGRDGLSEKEAEQFINAADKAGFYVDVQKSDKWFGSDVYVPTSLVPKEVDESPKRPIIGDQASADLSRVQGKSANDILNMTIDKFGNEVMTDAGGGQRQAPPQSEGIVSGAKPKGKPRLEVDFVDDGKSFADTMGGGEKAKATIPATINGRVMEIPLAVPTLTEQEFNIVKSGKEPTPEIVKKAVKYAEEKVGAGKNPMDTGSDSVVEGLIDRYKRNVNDPEVKRKLRGEDRDSKLKKSFLRTPPKQ